MKLDKQLEQLLYANITSFQAVNYEDLAAKIKALVVDSTPNTLTYQDVLDKYKFESVKDTRGMPKEIQELVARGVAEGYLQCLGEIRSKYEDTKPKS